MPVASPCNKVNLSSNDQSRLLGSDVCMAPYPYCIPLLHGKKSSIFCNVVKNMIEQCCVTHISYNFWLHV